MATLSGKIDDLHATRSKKSGNEWEENNAPNHVDEGEDVTPCGKRNDDDKAGSLEDEEIDEQWLVDHTYYRLNF